MRGDAVAGWVDRDDGRDVGGHRGEAGGDRGRELALDRAVVSAAELRVVALVDDPLHRGGVDVEDAAAVNQAFAAEEVVDQALRDRG